MLRRIKQQSNQQSNSRIPLRLTATRGRSSNYDSAQASSESNFNEIKTLSDADYEFLFEQLLEGVAHGWHQNRISKFFQQLNPRTSVEDWIAWLERFGQKNSLVSTPSTQQLGAKMIRLGELTQSVPNLRQIGAVANQIGRQLFYGISGDLIWEYDGPDLQFIQIATSSLESESDLSVNVVENIGTDSFTGDFVETLGDNPPSEENFSSLINNHLDSTTTEKNFDLAIDLNNQTEGFSSSSDNSLITETEQQLINLSQEKETFSSLDLMQEVIHEINSSDHCSDQTTLELVEGWFNLGLKQATAGELEQAISSWEKALEINPNLSAAWHNRGSALGRLEKYSEAIQSFDQALVIDHNNYQAWNDRAHALYQIEKWQEAISSWDKAIEILPGDYQFWYNRGCALEKLDRSEESIASYEKALEIKPDFQEARSRYINLLTDNPDIN